MIEITPWPALPTQAECEANPKVLGDWLQRTIQLCNPQNLNTFLGRIEKMQTEFPVQAGELKQIELRKLGTKQHLRIWRGLAGLQLRAKDPVRFDAATFAFAKADVLRHTVGTEYVLVPAIIRAMQHGDQFNRKVVQGVIEQLA